MAGDSNGPVSSVRDKMAATNELFNVEQFDDAVVDQMMARLANLPESAHDDAIEQFLFEYYYGNKTPPGVDSSGNISQQRLEELAAHAYMIEATLSLRDQSYTPGREGPTLSAICMEKYLHIGQYLLKKWERYEGADRQARVEELHTAVQHLLNSARVFTGPHIRFEFHEGFVLVLQNMDYIDILLPLPNKAQTSTDD